MVQAAVAGPGIDLMASEIAGPDMAHCGQIARAVVAVVAAVVGQLCGVGRRLKAWQLGAGQILGGLEARGLYQAIQAVVSKGTARADRLVAKEAYRLGGVINDDDVTQWVALVL
ncbi:hypothetical protein D3C81_1373830 [compost metagenome]